MKLQIICVAYERVNSLVILQRCFIEQSNPNWVLHIVYDGPAPDKIKDVIVNDERIHFWESPERYENYGHPNRRTTLQTIETETGDFILMTNDDNYYVPMFVEYMLQVANRRIGMVYCDTVHSHAAYDINYSELRENCIDMGAFIVREDIAKQTGFNHDHFSADGMYCEECLKTCHRRRLKAFKIHKCLFIHN